MRRLLLLPLALIALAACDSKPLLGGPVDKPTTTISAGQSAAMDKLAQNTGETSVKELLSSGYKAVQVIQHDKTYRLALVHCPGGVVAECVKALPTEDHPFVVFGIRQFSDTMLAFNRTTYLLYPPSGEGRPAGYSIHCETAVRPDSTSVTGFSPLMLANFAALGAAVKKHFAQKDSRDTAAVYVTPESGYSYNCGWRSPDAEAVAGLGKR